MLSKLITMKQLGQFVSEHQPEKIIDESYVWWLIRQGQDIVISWDYGNVFSCTMYFPTASDDYEELLKMADDWNGAHGWRQAATLARFRLKQIDQALNDLQSLAWAL